MNASRILVVSALLAATGGATALWAVRAAAPRIEPIEPPLISTAKSPKPRTFVYDPEATANAAAADQRNDASNQGLVLEPAMHAWCHDNGVKLTILGTDAKSAIANCIAKGMDAVATQQDPLVAKYRSLRLAESLQAIDDGSYLCTPTTEPFQLLEALTDAFPRLHVMLHDSLMVEGKRCTVYSVVDRHGCESEPALLAIKQRAGARRRW